MHQDQAFPNTRWSVILQVQGSDSGERNRALEQICSTYWLPIYAFARSQGLAPADAEDLTQTVLSGLLDRGSFEQISAEKGKLRSFLRVVTKNALRQDWRKAKRLKRGGDATMLSLDHEDAERHCEAFTLATVDDQSPDRIFDRHWGMNLLGKTMERLEAAYTGEGKAAVFAALKGVLGHLDRSGPSHKDLAAQLEMTEGAVRVAVHRLRKRYRRILKEEISLTLDNESEEAVEEELRYIFGVFAS
jgi:RNA polymerase sigma-70 factor (ECF subfamily)